MQSWQFLLVHLPATQPTDVRDQRTDAYAQYKDADI